MSARNPFRCINIRSAELLLERIDLLVLDARDAGTFDESHIDRAQLLSSATLTAFLNSNRDRPILIYCYHGNASREYAQIFSDFGFSEVYSLEGGYQAWCTRSARENLPVAITAASERQPAGPPVCLA